MANPRIEFVPFREEHLVFLAAWLREPHVAEFWQEDEKNLRDKFLNGLPARGVAPFVFLIEGKPSGYIQHYEACRVGGGWWPGATRGVFGIDQLLGDPTLLGRGIGTAVISRFVAELFRDPAVREIIADPAPGNVRAVRAYEKAGFVAGGVVETPGGIALLMRATRKS